MKACAIIAEYNPYHNGHEYQAKLARAKSQADCVIAIMSGNFTQRGEVALIDKWKRAEMALKSGAIDLIVELPVHIAVQSADFFGAGAVKIAKSLQCDFLSFGTDNQAEIDYQAFGEFFIANEEEITKRLTDYPDKSTPYPMKMTEILRVLCHEFPLDFSSPNHILGMSYAKENARGEQHLQLIPIQRIENHHLDSELTGAISSGTAIRKAWLNQKSLEQGVSTQTLEILTQTKTTDWEDYFPLLKYRIESSTLQELANIYQMHEGIEVRMKEKMQIAQNFDEFLNLIHTKRYTKNRLRRLCCYLLWNVNEEEIEHARNYAFPIVLGMNEAGKRYLNEKKAEFTTPLLSKIGKREKGMELSRKVDSIYQLASAEIEEQTRGRFPMFIEGY
ncbi:MAG: nucleotidyltransferase [Streptococcaceae bacterium]|nr:nucleotidyltransferase [Streptococcaceae bacterium]